MIHDYQDMPRKHLDMPKGEKQSAGQTVELGKKTLEQMKAALEKLAETGRQTFAIPDIIQAAAGKLTLSLDKKNPRQIEVIYPDTMRKKMATAAAALMAGGIISAGPAGAEIYSATISKHTNEKKAEEVTRVVEIPSGTTQIEIEVGDESIDAGDMTSKGFIQHIEDKRVIYTSEQPSQNVIQLSISFDIPADRNELPFKVITHNIHEGDLQWEEAGMQGSWIAGKPIPEFPSNDWGEAYIKGSALESETQGEGFKIPLSLRLGRDYSAVNSNPSAPYPWAVTPTIGLAYWNPTIGEISVGAGVNIGHEKAAPVLGKEGLVIIDWEKEGKLTGVGGKEYHLAAHFAQQIGKKAKGGLEAHGDVELGRYQGKGDRKDNTYIVLGGIGGFIGGGDIHKDTADVTTLPMLRLGLQDKGDGVGLATSAGFDIFSGEAHITAGITVDLSKKKDHIKVRDTKSEK